MNALFVLRPAKLRAFNFGHPCPSLVKGEVLSPDKIRATTGGIATPPTLPCTNPSKTAQSIENRHHPCLPCQREVDWRQGTNLNIIAFTCDMSTLFILQTFLPSRRRDCHTTNYASHQPLQNRTIPLAFRRGVGLPLPLHQSLLFSLIFVKEHLSLALLAPPVAPNTAIPTQPLQKNNNPSLNTFPTNQKPHLITGAVLLILNLTASQDYRQAD